MRKTTVTYCDHSAAKSVTDGSCNTETSSELQEAREGTFKLIRQDLQNVLRLAVLQTTLANSVENCREANVLSYVQVY